MNLDYSNLQNGSDIRGVAIAKEGEAANLGREETLRLTAAFAMWLSKEGQKPLEELTISVGYDSRVTARELKQAVCDSLSFLGVKTYDCGLASTPAMFMATMFEEFECDGAIMITASHLPYNRNGFKYFNKEGGLNKGDITEIIKSAEAIEEVKGEAKGSYTKADLMSVYSQYLKDKIIEEVKHKEFPQKPLTGLKIVVDAGNGAGGFYATDVLAPLGANIEGSQFLEPDGTFPNHPPNPENKEAMESICKAVIENKANFGLIFDTDVDRSSAVDGSGKEINRNSIVAMAAALIAKENPGTTVVTDSITSDYLTEYLEKCLGLKHLRFKRGYKNVINKSIELNNQGIDSQLAIETSGHAAYKENYFLDDGAYLATKIVIKAAQLKQDGQPLEVVLQSLKEPVESTEYRFAINRTDFSEYGDYVLDNLNQWASGEGGKKVGASVVTPNYEGVRINFNNDRVKGWCLLRKSLHDPQMPLNIEAEKGSCQDILEILSELFEPFDIS